MAFVKVKSDSFLLKILLGFCHRDRPIRSDPALFILSM